MGLGELLTKKRIAFLLLFSLVAFIGYQINFSPILGMENQSFTLFQFFGPIAGGFLGPIFGAIAVLITEAINFIAFGKTISFFGFARLFTIAFAAIYFGTHLKSLKGKIAIIIPLVCILLFSLHPVGQQVWFFSLFWLIPLIGKLYPFKLGKLVARGFGATFTAHAIGTTAFIYAFPTTAAFWVALIPIVLFERSMFAAGIAVSFVAFNTVLAKLEHLLPSEVIQIDPKYVLSKKLFRA